MDGGVVTGYGNGRYLTIAADGSDSTISVYSGNTRTKAIALQAFDDGTSLTTVNYPSGFQTLISTDVLGGSKQIDLPNPNNLNIQSTTNRDAFGAITGSSSSGLFIDTDPSSNTFNQPVANTYSVTTNNSAGIAITSGTRTVNPVDGSYLDVVWPIDAQGGYTGAPVITPSNPANPASSPANTGTLGTQAQQTIANAANAFSNSYSLIKAIQNNQPLPSIASGIRLFNDLSPGTLPPQLTGVASAIGALTSLYALDAALARGDLAGVVVSGVGAFSLGVSAYASLAFPTLSSTAALASLGAVGTAAAAVSQALPYLNIANSLIQGDVGGAVGGAVGAYIATLTQTLGVAAGPLGALAGIVIGAVLSDLFGDNDPPPIPWGTANDYWDAASNRIQVRATGYGDGAIGAAYNTLSSLTGALQSITVQYNSTAQPGLELGVIAQRLGGLTYSAYTGRYGVDTINPVIGQQLGSTAALFGQYGANDSAVFEASNGQGLSSYYIGNALARQAIAPLWEVTTANAQQANGISNAGLSEVERAANLGHLAQATAPTATLRWNLIGLDFGGRLATTALNISSVRFNVDGAAEISAAFAGTTRTGYQHTTEWLNTADGFLVVDKNVNGTIDNAEELFSNSKVAEPYRGMASLATYDANGDGLINTLDPIFSQMHVWRDAAGNGQINPAEYQSLNGLNISSLDYANGTFIQAGQAKQMSTLSLTAETLGNSYVQKPDGIQINTSNGTASTLLVTQTRDLSQLLANQDGITTDRGVAAVIATRGNGSTVQGLLDNDRVSNAPNALLNVTGVGNVSNGQVSFDAATGNVTFTPDANFYGAAGFDYNVSAGAYGTGTGHVEVTVSNANQAPVITGAVNTTPGAIYGWNPVEGQTLDGPTTVLVPLLEPGFGYAAYPNITVPNYFLPLNFWIAENYTPDQYRYRSDPVTYRGFNYTGKVYAADPDDAVGSLTWTIVRNSQYGQAQVDANGNWAFTVTDLPINRNVVDFITVKVTDPFGQSATYDVTFPILGDYPPPPDGPFPIILDLDNSGFDFISASTSTAYLQDFEDGLRHQVAWFGSGDGVLAFDKYGDGVVHDTSQIAFRDYLPGAQTDLQGLAAFDSNHDGIISQLDARWAQLGVWVDADAEGLSDAGEYQTLAARGIESISLTSNNQFAVDNGVIVHGTTTFTRTDGSTSGVADVTLPYTANVLAYNPDGSQRVTTAAIANPQVPMAAGEGDNLVLGNKGDNTIVAGRGNNVVTTGAGNDLINVGDGNNSIYSGDGKDVIVVGHGNNTVFLHGGPKWVVAGRGNNVVVGGTGNNIIMAGAGNNTLYAGSGNSVLYAGNGNNTLVGGLGRNALIAGNGNNVLMDGGGRADMHAGTGSNTFEVTNALSTVIAKEGAGINTVKTSVSWTLGANQDVAWGTGRAAITLTGNELDNQIIGNGAASTLVGGAGNDSLADSGGAANMLGGVGNDTYIVSNAAATITETNAEGHDVIKTSVSYALPAHIEKLIATGNAALTLTGNDEGVTLVANNAGNTLVGGAGVDTLISGAGADTLMGGGGNDTYVLQRGGGRDTVADASGTADSVLVKGNLTALDITFTRRDLDVIVGIKNTADALVLKNWFSGTLGQESIGVIESIRFVSGAPSIDSAYIHSLLDNHTPTAVADAGAAQEDAVITATGNVLTNDTDIDLPYDSRQHLNVASAGTYAGVYGRLAMAADGSYVYTLNISAANVQALGRDAQVSDVFSYTVHDNALDNKTPTADLTINIQGGNDGPQAFADVAAVAQDGTNTATGNVLHNDTDVDTGDLLTVAAPGAQQGTYGDLTLNANGNYSYALNNSALNVQSLRGGQQVTDSFAYTATDGLATSASNLAVTVTGTNDTPVAFADAATTKEDATVVATGNLLTNDEDLDVGDTLYVASASVGTVQGIYGSLTLAANGSYIYALNNNVANVQALGRNAVVTDTFAYAAQDDGDTLLQGSSSLTVTITGTNDGPQAFVDVVSVKKDGTLTAAGNVLRNDTDVDAGDLLTVATPGAQQGTYGNLMLNANGSYSYALDNAAANMQSLRGGQQVTDSFAYTATDDLAISASNLAVTVTGTNDAPVAFADTASVKEDTASIATGNVLTNDKDVDQGTVLSVATVGSFTSQYGTLTLAANGGYTYTLNNSAAVVQKLGFGQSVTDVFAYTVKDDDINTLTATATLSITIAGTNDAPIVVSAIATQAARENQAFTYTVQVATFTDVDTGDALTYSAQAVDALGNLQALPGWLSFNAAARAFTGTPGSTLGGSFDFVVTATDRVGAKAASRFTLNISDEFAGTGVLANVLTGNNHNNVLNGTSLNETIIGKAGSDTLYGGAGDDVLDGGTGADLLFGDAGNDTIKFSVDGRWSGGDYVQNFGSPGQAGSGQRIHLVQMNRSLDAFDGGGGIDTLLGTSGADAIVLDDGSQRIKNIEIMDVGAGDDVVDLTSNTHTLGDVTVYGGNDNDVIWSSSGNDMLYGGNGNDAIDGGAGADWIDGGAGADVMAGGAGNDCLDGRAGNDVLIGGTGNDSYFFGRGYGLDNIQENDATAGNHDTLQFTGGIAINQIWLRKVSNNLEVSVIGTADKMTITNWYLGNQYRVEEFKTSDGKVLLDSQVQNLVQAMAAFAPPAAGQTTLTTAQQAALTPLIAANWQ